MAERWIQGDHLLVDDVTGFVIRASESRKQWDGAMVHQSTYETRNPQDLIKARRERPGVLNARPQPPDAFIGPLTTTIATAAIAGDQTLVIDSSARMEAGDHISIMLDGGATFRAIIQSITDASHIVLTAKMPGTAAVGQMVIDNTAMSAPDIG